MADATNLTTISLVAPRPLPPPRDPRYQCLDAWRGLACVMVVVVHCAWYLGGTSEGNQAADFIVSVVKTLWIGVPIFFVISGYCIAATADSTRRKRRVTLTFFKRRFRRIYPPYWICFSLTALIVYYGVRGGWPGWAGDTPPLAIPQSLTLQQWLGNLTLTEGIRPYFLSDLGHMFLGHAWTLCYEEQFYAICGILLLFTPRRFFAGLTVVTLATLCVAPFTFKKIGFDTLGFFFDGRWLIFAAGALVYYELNYASKRLSTFIRIGFVMSVAGALGLHQWLLRPAGSSITQDQIALGLELVVGSVFASILSMTHASDKRLASLRCLRPFFFCGRICYSLYLVHLPLAFWTATVLTRAGVKGLWPTLTITVPIGMGISVLAGWLFHLAVERYFLNTPAPRLASGDA